MPAFRKRDKDHSPGEAAPASTRRTLRASLVVLFIVGLLGLGYVLHVRNQLDEIRADQARLLADGADRLGRFLDNILGSVEKLATTPESKDRFLEGQPYLEPAPPTTTAAGDGPEAGGEPTVAFHPQRRPLTISIQGIAPERTPPGRRIALAAAGGDGLERVFGTPETTFRAENGRVTLTAVEVDLRLEVPLDGPAGAERRLDPERSIAITDGRVEVSLGSADDEMEIAWRPSDLAGDSAGDLVIHGRQRLEPGQDAGALASSLGRLAPDAIHLRLDPAQLSPAPGGAEPLAITPAGTGCGLWAYDGERPLFKVADRPQGRLQPPAEAAVTRGLDLGLFGRELEVAGAERSLQLETGQRKRAKQVKDLRAGYSCPLAVAAPAGDLALDGDQRSRIEGLLRQRRPGADYREALGALRVKPLPGRPEILEVRLEEPLEPDQVPPLPPLIAEQLAAGQAVTVEPHPATGTPLFRFSTRTEIKAAGRLDAGQQQALERLMTAARGPGSHATFHLRSPLRSERTGAPPRLVAEARRWPTALFQFPVDPRALEGHEIAERQGTGLLAAAAPGGGSLQLFLRPAGTAAASSLHFALRLDAVLEALPLGDAFESLFIADAEGRVRDQVWPSPAVTLGQGGPRGRPGVRFDHLERLPAAGEGGEEAGGGPSPPGAEAGGEGRPGGLITHRLPIEGLAVEVVCQPFRFDAGPRPQAPPPLTWRLCGLVDSNRVLRQAFGVAPYLAGGLVVLVILGFLSLPFLRFAFMEPHERLKRRNIYLLVGSTWCALMVLTLILSAWHRHRDLRDVLEHQLADLADRVEGNLERNLAQARHLLQQLDAGIAAGGDGGSEGKGGDGEGRFRCSWLARFPDEIPQQTALLLPPEERWNLPSFGLELPPPLPGEPKFPDFTSVFWLDADGRQIAKATVSTANTQVVAVPQREYFRAIREGRPWTLEPRWREPGPPFFFQTYESITTAERGAALSMESAVDTLCVTAEGGQQGLVAVITGVPPAVRAPVVSPPFGFAVVDARGDVLFHSDPRKALASNLFHEAAEPRRLAAAMASRSPQLLDGWFLNRPLHLLVRPLFHRDRPPGERPHWWIVSFYDEEMPATTVIEALLRSFLPLAVFGLILGTVSLVLRRRLLEDLWPARSRAEDYLQLTALYVLVIVPLIVALNLLDRPLGRGLLVLLFVLFAVLPALVLVVTLLRLDRPPAGSGEEERAGGGEEAGAEEAGGGGEKATAAGAAGAARKARKKLEQVSRSDLFSRQIFGRRATLPYVVGVILLWLVVAVLPAAAFFKDAWFTELALLLKHDVQTALERREERRRRIEDELRPLPLGSHREAVLAERLERRDDLYLYSPAVELLPHSEPLAEIVRRASERNAGSWMMRRLPVYNSAAHGLRFMASASFPYSDWSRGGPGERERERERVMVLDRRAGGGGAMNGSQGAVTGGQGAGASAGRAGPSPLRFQLLAEGARERGIHLALLLLAVVFVLLLLACWVGYAANHVCFSRVRRLRTRTAEDLRTAARRGNVIAVVSAVADRAAVTPRGCIAVDLSPAGLERPLPAGEGAVVCQGLEEGLADPALRRAKRSRIEELLAAGRRVLLVCSQRPSVLLLTGTAAGAAAGAGDGEAIRLDAEERAAWSRLLARFEEGVAAVAPPGERPASDGAYLALWASCSREERLALIQLAEEGVLNPKQGRTVESLLERGLVELDPVLRLPDPGFLRFLLRAGETTQVRELEADAQAGGWRHYRLIFASVLVAIVAFLFLTERQLFNTATALLATLGAAIPAAFHLIGSLQGGGWRQGDS